MNLNEISGQRQLAFMGHFDYIREAGTEGERRAALTIQRELENFGIDSHLEEFAFDTWKSVEAVFTVTKPYEKTYKAAVYLGSGSTPEGGFDAPFLYVENGDDISLSYAKGKIVMINEVLFYDNYESLIQAEPLAFLVICGSPIDQGEDLLPADRVLRSKNKYPVPGGLIHYADAVEIVTKGASHAHLILKQERRNVVSQNVIARIEGSDKAEEILTLTAHYDSVPAGKGAYDNMAGGAIITELCRYFKAHTPRRTMEFIWFGAEEKGLRGSQNYAAVHKDELKDHQFNMNVDLAGQLVGGTVLGVTASPEACEVLWGYGREIGLGMNILNRIWGSDSNTFAYNGVPAMTLNRDGFGMHTRHDTIELISPWSLQRSAQLLGYIADKLGNAEEFPIPRAVPEEFIEKLRLYFEDRE